MATRGSIPKIMEMAGVEMLPPETGVAWVRRELGSHPFRGEVVVAGRLGRMAEGYHPTGGLDPGVLDTQEATMVGEVVEASVLDGLLVRTRLDPKRQPFLDDHRIDAAVDALVSGPAVLPDGLERIAGGFDDAGLSWAFDGTAALVLHGLAAEVGTHAQVVAVGTEALRRFLYALGGVGIVDRDGQPIWHSWLSVDFARVGICTATAGALVESARAAIRSHERALAEQRAAARRRPRRRRVRGRRPGRPAGAPLRPGARRARSSRRCG